MKYIIGIDVGGTKISAGLTQGKKVSHIITIPTQSQRGRKSVIENTIQAARNFHHPKIHAIGIGIAGQVDARRGVVLSSPNMGKGFTNVPLARLVRQKTGKHVCIQNDVKCFTLSESRYGAGKNHSFVVGLTLGTGVGGGIVLNNAIIEGAHGTTGEFGHLEIEKNGRRCSCKKSGHLEAYASGKAMTALYRELTHTTRDTFFIEEQAAKGNRHARSVLNTMSQALGSGIANIINTLNPEIVVIGGGISRVSALWPIMLAQIKNKVFYPKLKKTKIARTALKNNAVILGASCLCH